jgi:Transglycosylase SLT domain
MAVVDQKIKNGGIDPTYYSRVVSAESGGNSNAKNPNSSASGNFQFIKSTWNAVVDKYGLGYSENDRFDKYKSKEVAELFTRDNAEQLKKYGINPNNTDLYAAHFMGVGGAHKLLSAQRKDPNQSIYNVATTAQINANKNIFLHKNGTPKTVGQVYQILGDKINKTHNYITNYKQTNEYKTRVTNGDLKLPTIQTPKISNLVEPMDLGNLAEQEQINKEQESLAAKMDLQNKQNEENLFQDLLKASQLQYVDPNQVEDYIEQSQTSEQGVYQSGGKIPVSSNGVYEVGAQKVLVPTNGTITMKSVPFNILGISQETGETKMMFPNQEYFFNNTKNVLEIPQIKNKNKRFS